jgi:hypothetical protein
MSTMVPKVIFLAALLFLAKVKAQENPVVIELFTSQGCSSCPVADRNLSQLLNESRKGTKEIYALSFHVDYWNYIGWKDPYSQKLFTERQRIYAEKLESSVYTPQMIVNGEVEFVGSSLAEARNAINKTAAKKSNYQIQILEWSIKDNKILFSYTLNRPPENETLNIALVERDLQNYVPKGENEGRTLHHDNVVKQFKSIRLEKSGMIEIEIAKENKQNTSVILYIQDENWKVKGAISKSLE